MNTIIIDEKTISVDGVIFERKEPEFKVGQWVIGVNYYPETPARIIAVTECGNFSMDNYSDYCKNSVKWKGDRGYYIRHATHSEIKSHLIKVAREKYKNGSCVRSAKFNGKFNYDELRRFEYESAGDILWVGGMILYCSGKWAEIVPTKKPLPKTKGEHVAYLSAYQHSTKTIEDFLKDYE